MHSSIPSIANPLKLFSSLKRSRGQYNTGILLTCLRDKFGPQCFYYLVMVTYPHTYYVHASIMENGMSQYTPLLQRYPYLHNTTHHTTLHTTPHYTTQFTHTTPYPKQYYYTLPQTPYELTPLKHTQVSGSIAAKLP